MDKDTIKDEQTNELLGLHKQIISEGKKFLRVKQDAEEQMEACRTRRKQIGFDESQWMREEQDDIHSMRVFDFRTGRHKEEGTYDYVRQVLDERLSEEGMAPCMRILRYQIKYEGRVLLMSEVVSYLLNKWNEVEEKQGITATEFVLSNLATDNERVKKIVKSTADFMSEKCSETPPVIDCERMRSLGKCVAECGVESPLQWAPVESKRRRENNG